MVLLKRAIESVRVAQTGESVNGVIVLIVCVYKNVGFDEYIKEASFMYSVTI